MSNGAAASDEDRDCMVYRDISRIGHGDSAVFNDIDSLVEKRIYPEPAGVVILDPAGDRIG